MWWASRRPRRAVGPRASLFVAYHPLVLIGFVDYLAVMRTAAVMASTAARDTVFASSEAAELRYEWAQEWSVIWLKIWPLRKWLGLIVACALAGCRGPSELLMKETPSVVSSSVGETSKNRVQILPTMFRLDEFRKQLDGTSREAERRAPRSAPSDATVGTGSNSTPTKDPVAGQLSADASPETANERRTRESSEAVKLAIKRMHQRAQPAQQIFLEQREKFKEVPVEEWAAKMPELFGQRLAPEEPSEVYASGKTAETRARDFARDRDLLDNYAAREMVATSRAVDTGPMTDRERGLPNRAPFERLVRKVYAPVRFRNVQYRPDWSMPKVMRRLDP